MSVYRTSALGQALEDALDEACRNFTQAERNRVLEQYDKAFLEAFDSSKAKATFKGHAATYRFVDGVWQFELDGSTQFKFENADTITSMGSTLLVCTDAKIARPDKYNNPPAPAATTPSASQ